MIKQTETGLKTNELKKVKTDSTNRPGNSFWTNYQAKSQIRNKRPIDLGMGISDLKNSFETDLIFWPSYDQMVI